MTVVTGLEQPDTAATAIFRATQRGLHERTPCTVVLQRRVDRNRTNAAYRATFIDEVTSDDLSIDFCDETEKPIVA